MKGARGGANTESDDELDLDEDPAAKANLVADEDDDEAEFLVIDPYLLKTRDLLLSVVNALELPANPLDTLIDLLGGVRNVAEMTGRQGLMVKDAAGKVRFVKRNEAAGVSIKALNLHERNAFMDGKKMVAIISEAASTGISLQADRRAINQRRRAHFTLELPWCVQPVCALDVVAAVVLTSVPLQVRRQGDPAVRPLAPLQPAVCARVPHLRHRRRRRAPLRRLRRQAPAVAGRASEGRPARAGRRRVAQGV
jgi:hypothetical protein